MTTNTRKTARARRDGRRGRIMALLKVTCAKANLVEKTRSFRLSNRTDTSVEMYSAKVSRSVGEQGYAKSRRHQARGALTTTFTCSRGSTCKAAGAFEQANPQACKILAAALMATRLNRSCRELMMILLLLSFSLPGRIQLSKLNCWPRADPGVFRNPRRTWLHPITLAG